VTVDHPLDQLEPAFVWRHTRFYSMDLRRVIQCLSLLPTVVRFGSGLRRNADRELAVFIVLRRWGQPDCWDAISGMLGMYRADVIAIYTATINGLRPYEKLVQTIDYARIVPQIPAMAANLTSLGAGTHGALFFADGKAHATCRPGTGKAAQILAAHLGAGYTPNLVQQAYYNGSYKMHGTKVQSVLDASGMMSAYVCSIRRHDSYMLLESAMELQMSVLFVDHAQLVPVSCLTDKAYKQSPNIKPRHKTNALNAMNPISRAAAKATDRANQKFRECVEGGFQKGAELWKMASDKRKHRLFADGTGQFNRISSWWLLQVLFTNLHTCMYEAEFVYVLGYETPTPEEYLKSANAGTLASVPGARY
jgi:hypothetical protein